MTGDTTSATRRQAWAAVAASAARTAALLATGRLRSPRGMVGTTLAGEDGSTSVVFRETLRPDLTVTDPVVLVVRFRLRWIGRARPAHALFRRTCVVNTPLFAGFPGFRDKLWLHDVTTGVYRGVYVWDGSKRAHWYADRLTRVLELVAVAGSVGHTVVPGTRRDPFPAVDLPGWHGGGTRHPVAR